ncbi:MAG: hypothetical protein U9Q81_15555 [Pseudomonadota bacterium]|nr:hypothetical protein [Pseudomonadota bacterium]
MVIRTTTDPITLHDVPNPEEHPYLFEGDKENGLLIYFESEETRRMYQEMEMEDRKVVQGDSTEDYVAEG